MINQPSCYQVLLIYDAKTEKNCIHLVSGGISNYTQLCVGNYSLYSVFRNYLLIIFKQKKVESIAIKLVCNLFTILVHNLSRLFVTKTLSQKHQQQRLNLWRVNQQRIYTNMRTEIISKKYSLSHKLFNCIIQMYSLS